MKLSILLIATTLATVALGAAVPSEDPKAAKTAEVKDGSQGTPKEAKNSKASLVVATKDGDKKEVKNGIDKDTAASEKQKVEAEKPEIDEAYKLPDASPLSGLFQEPNSLAWNNAYNFATGQITNTYAHPGRAGNKKWTPSDNCDSLIAGVIADGFKKIEKSEVGKYDGENNRAHYFALLLGGKQDPQAWSFARLIKDYEVKSVFELDNRPAKTESVGWYMKQGAGPIRVKDYDGKDVPPNDLEKANFGYKKVCAYFKSSESVI